MTTGSAGFDRTSTGQASSCVCAMCRPVTYGSPKWSNLSPPISAVPKPPALPAIRDRVLAAIEAELAQEHPSLTRLRDTVQAMDLMA